MKFCPRCKVDKPKTDFSLRGGSRKGNQYYCKVCYSAIRKKWRKAHKERAKFLARRQYHKNIDKSRADMSINNRRPGSRFCQLRWSAKRRNLECKLTLEDFKMLINNLCHYCHGALPATSGGLDRKDNTLGYTVENCVPCCSLCNSMKSVLNYSEFFNQIAKILEVQALRKSG